MTRVVGRFELNRKGLGEQTTPLLVAEAKRLADDVTRVAREKAPFRTGYLRSMILPDAVVIRSPFHVETGVTSNAPYSIFVHQGTRPHVIRAVNARALSFYWPRVGRQVFFASVNHPGTRPNPFMAEAVREVVGEPHP